MHDDVAANLRVKEVRICDSERFVICYNADGAQRDAQVRARMLAQLDELIKDCGKLTRDLAGRTAGSHVHQAWPKRYLRVAPGTAARRRRQDCWRPDYLATDR